MDDLLTLGLKPYDLVWVEGRSAAWRYASEVSELKAYAPVVEEQPFDRFFKKPSESVITRIEGSYAPTQEILHQPKAVMETTVNPEPIQIVEEKVTQPEIITPVVQKPSYPGYETKPVKRPFVSMPETNSYFSDETPAQVKKQDEIYAQYLPKPKPVQAQIVPDNNSSSPIKIKESDESKLETKYAQSLDDIKEMYINTLVQRKTKNKRKEIVKRYIRPAAIPLLLVIVGVAIGYFITSKKTSLQASESIKKPTQQQTTPAQTTPQQNEEVNASQQNNNSKPDQQPEVVATNQNKSNKIVTPSEEKNAEPQDRLEKKIIQAVRESKAGVADSRSEVPVTSKQKAVYEPATETPTYSKRDVEVDPSTGERKSVTRTANDVSSVKNNTPREDDNADDIFEHPNKAKNDAHAFLGDRPESLLKMVTVKTNNYLRGTFGGIKGLELTIFNNSNFMLDQVSVELQIIKPSEQPLRTDIITFKNVAANGNVTVKVPDSQRGIRVDYHITNIESKQFQKNTAGL